jgi:hypothetical protein
MAVIIETAMAEDLEYGVNATTKTHPSGGVLNGHQISISSFSIAGPAGEAPAATWAPGTIASGSVASTTIAAPGAALGDKVMADLTSIGTGALLLSAHVSQANEVTVVLANLTGVSVTVASGTLSVVVFHHRTATPA